MKVLLDENLPHDLRHFLPGHDVYTVAFMGWASLKNGELLRTAGNDGFDVMVTKDSGVAYEQHVPALPIAVVILKSQTNKLDDLLPLVAPMLIALSGLTPRSIVRVG